MSPTFATCEIPVPAWKGWRNPALLIRQTLVRIKRPTGRFSRIRPPTCCGGAGETIAKNGQPQPADERTPHTTT
jgi:hypothetical protein